MKSFNSFQLAAMFVATPFVISWLSEASFRWHGAAFWAALIFYVVQFGFVWFSLYDSMRKDGPWDWEP